MGQVRRPLQHSFQWLGSAALSVLPLASVGVSLVGALAATMLGSVSVQAADGSAQMALPYATGQSWSFYGPHNYADSADYAWNSLDFSGGDGQVRAAHGGIVHRDCPTGFVRIDHGDGYETTYYHLVNIAVIDSQVVTPNQLLGNTGAVTPCGGFAQGAHVHFSLWQFSPATAFNYGYSQMKDLANVQIGQWAISRGSAQYFGCLAAGQTYCSQGPPSWVIGGPIYNDGSAAQGFATEQVTVARRPGGTLEDLLIRGATPSGAASGVQVPTDENGTPVSPSWTDLGGVIKGSPTAVWNPATAVLDVLGIGTDDRVWHKSWSGSTGWTGWSPVATSAGLGVSGVALTEAVNVERRNDGGMDLFIRGPRGDAQHASLNAASVLQYWEAIGGAGTNIKGPPSGRWNASGSRLDVYAIGSNDSPYHIAWTTIGGWGGWQGPWTGASASAGTELIMAVRRPVDDTVDLFLEGATTHAYNYWTDVNGNYLGLQDRGGATKGAPDGKWNGNQTRLDIFAIGTNDLEYRATFNNTSWTVWDLIPNGKQWT